MTLKSNQLRDWTQFPDTNFREGKVTSVSQRWGTELHHIFRGHTSVVDALQVCVRCQIRSFVLKSQAIKGDWCRKSRPNLGLFDPCKNREGWAKCLSEFYEFGLGSSLWYTFDGCLWVVLKNRVWVSKKGRAKHIRPSDYHWCGLKEVLIQSNHYVNAVLSWSCSFCHWDITSLVYSRYLLWELEHVMMLFSVILHQCLCRFHCEA